MIKISLIRLIQYPILSQLFLEEALLRADNKNYCLINEGTQPAIVLGISAKIDQVVSYPFKLPLIRRFSGGGTVVVDEKTLFITFIFNQKEALVPLQPEAIMKWSEPFYKEVFKDRAFELKENDYVIDQKKCGGNAQYLCKDRFLHHTSFLWDFDKEKMQLLKYPPKTPAYRKLRSHEDFLCILKDHFTSKNEFIENCIEQLHQNYDVTYTTLEEQEEILARPHRRSTTLL
jgi:lipoate-protein ligase A